MVVGQNQHGNVEVNQENLVEDQLMEELSLSFHQNSSIDSSSELPSSEVPDLNLTDLTWPSPPTIVLTFTGSRPNSFLS